MGVLRKGLVRAHGQVRLGLVARGVLRARSWLFGFGVWSDAGIWDDSRSV